MKFIKSILLVLVVIISSCKDKKEIEYKPDSIGAVNSLAVVMENHLWEGPIGDKVRAHFASPVPGLGWDEAKFTINQMPQYVFSGTVRNTRSVLFVAIDDTLNIAHIKKNLYSSPQRVGVIKGINSEEIVANIDKIADKMIVSFKEMELAEQQKRFLRSLSKEKALENKFDISLTIPSAYKVGKEEDNFVWIDRQIQKGHMNIIAYTMPADAFRVDSTFVKDIIRMKDSIGKKYIPGDDVPGKITYMITEKAYAPQVFPVEVGGKKAVEVRGIWEVKNYPMAGPFVMYIIKDEVNNRNIVLEGFTFAPATEKRDYMFELEAILKTLKIN